MLYSLFCQLFFTTLLLFSLTRKVANTNFFEKIFKNQKHYYLYVIILIVIGILIRTYKFGAIPAGVNHDEAMAAVDALALSQYGTDRFLMPFPVHFTAWGFAPMNVLLSYLMIPFIKILGFSIISARLPTLVVSLISLWVFYSFMRKIFGSNQALIGLLFLVINPWHIMQSRWSLESNMLPHFLLFSFYFFYLGLKNRWALAASMVLFGLTMYAYGIAFYSVPLIILLLSIYLFKTKLIETKDYLLYLAIYLMVALPILLVIVVNALKLKTVTYLIFTIPFLQNSGRMNDLLPFSANIPHQLISNIGQLLGTVFIQVEDLPWNSISDFGPLYLFALPLMISGLFYLISGMRNNSADRTGAIVVCIWLIVALISGILVNDVNINRINIILYPLIMLSSLGFYRLVFKKNNNIYIAIISIAILISTFVLFSYNYFHKHNTVLSHIYYNGFGKSIEYAESSNATQIYVTSNTQYMGSQNVSEILTLFYAKTDAKYFNNKKDIYDKSGVKLLPYSSRYQYISPESYDFSQARPGTYIIRNEEVEYLDNAGFTFKSFDDFTVAEKQ